MLFEITPRSTRIINKSRIDDGTTTGKEIYMDDAGKWYEKASNIDMQSTLSNCQTIDKNGYFTTTTLT